MMKYLQKLGKSLMLPVACLPAAGILMGIGYWISPSVMSGVGDPNVFAFFLVKAGGAIIDNMAILFAIGVALGMADDRDGTSALAGIVSWLMTQLLLSPAVVSVLTGAEANAAFGKINNQFIGIISGLIGATCYNRFKNTKLPDALGFFSGKRSVAIVAALVTIVVDLILFFIWPIVYTGLVSFGEWILSTGPIGVGIYAFFNRLLIPVGLHHALNSVFWFDVANIADIARFWGTNPDLPGTLGVTGQYMVGFFPVMMFGLPAAALAMYHTSKPQKKKLAYGLLISAAFCAFFTGVTEPLEFSFMFLAPGLYVVHALLTGVSAAVCAVLPVRAGFNFSAGFVDWFLSFKAPMALNPWLIIPIGLVFAVLYYLLFRVIIVKFNLKRPAVRMTTISKRKRKLPFPTPILPPLRRAFLKASAVRTTLPPSITASPACALRSKIMNLSTIRRLRLPAPRALCVRARRAFRSLSAPRSSLWPMNLKSCFKLL